MNDPSRLSVICLQLIDTIDLEATGDLGYEELVHNLRVLTKQLRAAWKMVPHKKLAAQRKAALIELSSWLAGERDIAVLIELATRMASDHPEAPFSTVVDYLEKAKAQLKSTDMTDAIRTMLKEEKSAWAQVRFDSIGLEQSSLRKALRISHKDARLATIKALKTNDPETWHDWRKRVKRLRYQREFLAKIQSRTPGKWDLRISLLGSALGIRNDLANLILVVEKLGNDPNLRKAIAVEERKILGNSRRLGRRNLLAR